ncbi:MAG TPA: RNA methyltransferase [Pyrinomonadaceae bacterium]|nr:RNA methyltransferase [Pyrinomonadaceae bacterium]HMP64873.1 RNA methyltransferase [Pyrinomonadaceae bacterium]
MIKSRSNEKLKFVRAIRDGRRDSFIFVEGEKLVGELAAAGLPVSSVFASASFAEKPENRGLLDRCCGSSEIFIVADQVFSSIADTRTPQGIVAVAERPADSLETIAERLLDRKSVLPLAVFLDRVNDPVNLGAIVRTAEAAGAAGVITSIGSADAFSPKSLRGSMGSLFRLPVAEGIAVDDLVAFARGVNAAISATGPGKGTPHTDLDWTKPRVLAFGSESHGVSDELLSVSGETITIDICSPVESLNLAVSCGVILFHARSVRLHRRL